MQASTQNENSFIEFVNSPTLTQQQNHYAQNWITSPYTFEYKFCRLKKDLLQNETLEINLLGQSTLIVDRRTIVNRTGKMYSWFGHPAINDGNVNFVVNGSNVTGWIFCSQGTYYIYPIGEGLHIMFNCIEDNSKSEKNDVNNQPTKDLQKAIEKIDPETGYAKMLIGSDCKVRLAVCFTDDVADDHADMVSFVQQCIDVTNEVLLNSEVYFEVELARSYENDYAELGINEEMLIDWETTTDGVLDEITTIRTYYDADINVLLVSDVTNACGRASTDDIATSVNNFCSLDDGCALANQYTFPHEVAHLFGCNHDPFITVEADPYYYGHGHVNIVDTWRTVMAYTDFCDTLGLTCGRIPHFSNPDVFYDGAATGTTEFFPFTEVTSDNAQVLNNTVDEISAIEVTISNKSLPSENIYAGESGDVIATNSTTHSGSYTIYADGSMSFRAGNYVWLKPGFHALSGSSFVATIETCDPLRTAFESENTSLQITRSVIYPNPNEGVFMITSDLSGDLSFSLQLYDLNGKLVWQKTSATVTENCQVDVSDLPKGIYSLHISSDAGIEIQKVVIQ